MRNLNIAEQVAKVEALTMVLERVIDLECKNGVDIIVHEALNDAVANINFDLEKAKERLYIMKQDAEAEGAK